MRAVTDPALPGLAVALDPDALLGLLQARLPECRDELDLEEARIFDVRYRPGATALVLYQLKVRGRHGGRSQRQLLSILALPPGRAFAPPSPEALRRYAALEDRALRTPHLPLPEAGLVAYAFPLDPVLEPLLRAFEPASMREAFRPLWRSRGARVRRVRPRCLGYTPLARAAIAYEVLSEDRATRAPELRHVVGKIQTKEPASALFAKAWAAWRAAGPRVRLSPPVGYVPAINMHLQEHVEGTRLGDLAGSGTFVKWTRETARSLARFHALSIPVAGGRSAAKEIRVVARWCDLVTALRPDLTSRAARLRDRLAPRLEAGTADRGPVHGDFHPANLLVDADHVTFIDLDQMTRGDPALDVGRFLASLRVSALRVSGDAGALQSAASAFLDRYLTHAREDEERVRLFEAACLLIAAATGFRLQRDGWERGAETLFAEAERLVERADARTASAARPAPAKGCAGEGAQWSHDPVLVRAVLDAPIREVYGAVARKCRVRSAPPGGRAERVRYELSGERAGEPWRLTIEAIVGQPRRALERLGALREALAGVAEAPLVPRPVAYWDPLRLLLVEPPCGTPLGALLGDPLGLEAAACAGRALAAAHAAPLAGDGEHPLEDELRRSARRVAELAEQRPGLRADVESLWRAAEARLRGSADAPPSALWRPSLDDVLWCGGRIALVPRRRLALGHPSIDAADLLARLRRRGVEKGVGDAAAAMARRFREAYCEARGVPAAELAAFEAIALLRAACSAARRREPHAADALVALASATLRGRSGAPDLVLAEAAAGAHGARRDSDAVARARLRGALARECRGVTGLVGPADPALVRKLESRGLRVRELGLRPPRIDADPGRWAPDLDTILVHGLLERLGSAQARELLGDAWARLRPDGRLVVCVRHEGDEPTQGGRTFDRRRLRRLLRPLGTPRLVTGQPYRWLVMTVRTRERPSPGVRERYRVIADLCRGRVMELGCGTGELARTLADRSLEVEGVDLSEAKIALARQRHPQVRFRAADIRDLEVTAGYDSVVLSEVLEHVGEQAGDAILDKAWELVAAGGRLVVSVPHEDCVPHPNHVRTFDRAALAGLLERFGPPRLVTEQPYRYLLMYVDRA
jgi:SAM-dependent methyltransferase